jgi:tRNA-dihydrouridine synthase B
VVKACEPAGVPVTLKMRTGWCQQAKNAPLLALVAEQAGVQMLTIHGRTREQGYKGVAEHDTVAHIKSRVRIPVVANGDIDSPEAAQRVLQATGCDAVMIGRAAQGRPWLFAEVAHYLATGQHLAPPSPQALRELMLDHLQDHYSLYGEFTGVRTARKHLGWYARALPGSTEQQQHFRLAINQSQTCDEQIRQVQHYFDSLAEWKQAA